MAYSKQLWVDDVSVLSATRLNHMEDGIEAAQPGVAGGTRVVEAGPVYDTTIPSGTATSGYFVAEKSDTAQDSSILFRSDGHTKGEIGLPGDDDLHVKAVTGATESTLTFTDAIIVKNATAKVYVPTSLGVGTVPVEKVHVADNRTANQTVVKVENTASSGSEGAGFVLAGRSKSWTVATDVALAGGDNLGISSTTAGYPPRAIFTPTGVGIINDTPATALDVAGAATLRNMSAPSTPTTANVLYSESGLLKAKGPSGGLVVPLGEMVGTTWVPSDHGYLAWSSEPATATGSTILTTAGVVYGVKIKLPVAATITSIACRVTTAGNTMTNSFAGLLDSTGTRVGVTADKSSVWNVSGYYENALTATYAASAGIYYVVFVVGSATTLPTFARQSASNSLNDGLTAAGGFRAWSSGTGQTAIPSSVTLSGTAAFAGNLWVALK